MLVLRHRYLFLQTPTKIFIITIQFRFNCSCLTHVSLISLNLINKHNCIIQYGQLGDDWQKPRLPTSKISLLYVLTQTKVNCPHPIPTACRRGYVTGLSIFNLYMCTRQTTYFACCKVDTISIHGQK